MANLVNLALGITGLVMMAYAAHRLVHATLAERLIGISAAFTGCVAVINQSWLSSPMAIAVGGAASAAICVFSITAQWSNIKRTPLGVRHASIVALPIWLFFADALFYSAQGTAHLFSRLLPALVLIFLIPLIAASQDPVNVVRSSVIAGFGLACALTLLAPNPWTPCTQFKCGPFNELFAGAFPSGNYFAAAASVTAICVLGMRLSPMKVVILSSSLLIIFATNSRTTQLALVIGLVAYGASTKLRDHKVILAWLTTIAITLVGVILVYFAEPNQYSNRGTIWSKGTDVLGDAWLFGRGLTSWTPEVLARNYMHSQSLLLLYSGGVCALLIFVSIVATTISRHSGQLLSLASGVAILTIFRGLTEVAWNPLAIDGTLFLALPLLILLASPAPGLTRNAGPHHLEGCQTAINRPRTAGRNVRS